MLKRNQSEPQQEPKPCTLYTYNANTFELFSNHPSAQEYLDNQEYSELPGSVGLVKSFCLPENTKLAHKYAVLVSHSEEEYLFLLRDFQYPEYMQKWAPIAPIIQNYLPWFPGQATKKLPS